MTTPPSWQKIEDIRGKLGLPIEVFASIMGITREHYYARKRGRNEWNAAGYLALAEKIQMKFLAEIGRGQTREAALMAVLDIVDGGREERP